ncbi:PEP2-like protein [Cadophora sp. DSE1049]|nr:PEP2-like protein [Cadophora sp. DSE1049]
MVDLHSLPAGSRPDNAIRNNGPSDLALERYKLRELAEGWPMYRDSCEWENFKSIFHPDAFIYTTWTGRIHHLEFIKVSMAGMDEGAFIHHRCHGATTDINLEATRAVTKLKATITQRFDLEGCEVDAESDCRFAFFFEKWEGEWRAKYVRHWYEKDKMIPVNPNKVPIVDEKRLAGFPVGYRYLSYCQEVTLGIKIILDMPGHRRENDNPNGKKHNLLYWQCKQWVDGEDIEV